jgi:hypothetical protein
MMMKQPHDVSLVLRGQIARAITMASAAKPLHLVVRRKVPLSRQGEQLGHLDVLLRLSCRGSGDGDGDGDGVLVFEWPGRASDHSAVRMLGEWSDRCNNDTATSHYRGLELERKDVTICSEELEEFPGVHLKVRFPLAEIPNALFELLDLAARVGLAGALRTELEQWQGTEQETDQEPQSSQRPSVSTNGVTAMATNPEDQTKIETIVHNVAYDPKIHPHVNPNEEVRKSDGTVFRLVMKRVGGRPTRTWIHVGSRSASTRAADS